MCHLLRLLLLRPMSSPVNELDAFELCARVWIALNGSWLLIVAPVLGPGYENGRALDLFACEQPNIAQPGGVCAGAIPVESTLEPCSAPLLNIDGQVLI